ncbi:acyl carrier protein [Amycolatopsis alba]|uniref:acyl carrier protein n=1 Tax=Amycolatopsis alba TaxID=76020 RepID=UPI000372403A|nr:acyl carrier protein [Amycolatopsis alba]
MTSSYHRICELLVSNFDLPRSELDPGITFTQLDLDSLSLVEMTVLFEDEFGLDIDPATDLDRTLAEAAAAVDENGAGRQARP